MNKTIILSLITTIANSPVYFFLIKNFTKVKSRLKY